MPATNQNSNRVRIKKLVYAALFLACAILLPFLTMNIQTFGKLLSPMHLPVFICGFVCDPVWGAVVGVCAPLIRSLIWHMPPLYPMAVAMAFELAAYGFFSGLFAKLFPKKLAFTYISLVFAMLCGRLVYSVAMLLMLGLGSSEFSIIATFVGTFTSTWAGIIVQLILVPPIVKVIEKFM